MTYSKFNILSINLFFLSMLTLPASFQLIRGIILILIFVTSLSKLVIDRVYFDKTLLFIGVINVIASCLFIINGVIQSAPGAISVSSVYVIWPILFFYFIGLNYNPLRLQLYMSTVLYGGIISAFLIILFILNEFFGLPGVAPIAAAQDYLGGFYDGFIQLHSGNLTTVFYMFTFSFTIFCLPSDLDKFNKGKKRKLVIFSMILSLIMIIISGRRAFWLICLLCPLIVIVLFKFARIEIKIKSFLIPFFSILLVTVIAFQALSLNGEIIIDRISSSFTFNDTQSEGVASIGAASNNVRKEQSEALINGWKKSPIIGAGLGASVSEAHDPKANWAYELSYVALLFQTGIVGVVIYSSSVIWIFITSLRVIRKNRAAAFMLLPQLVGLSCFLIINGSNPYLAKFDYLWTIFFPIATLNAYLLNDRLRVGYVYKSSPAL